MARNSLQPYESRTRLIDEGVVARGVTAIPMVGHTPGHTGYRIATARGPILLWGDLLNVPHVQLARAAASVISDVDKGQAIGTRQRVLRDAADLGLLVGGAHTEFPALFQTVFKNGAFSLRPAQWSEPFVEATTDRERA
jgi:glyoxylase-like metal-dependent hydrolase (beta-lactamase superfamily II)